MVPEAQMQHCEASSTLPRAGTQKNHSASLHFCIPQVSPVPPRMPPHVFTPRTTPSLLLPQDLCTYYALYLECASAHLPLSF